MSDIEQLKDQIKERLIYSGEYDRINTMLKERLAESGWFDKMKKLANGELNNQSYTR